MPEGHELGYINSSPRTVILKGPYETLAAMSHVQTKELSIEEVNDVISRRVLIEDLPDFVSFAPNQPFQVELSINILPVNKNNYYVIKNVPIKCINKTPNIDMQVPGRAMVDIYMSEEIEPTAKDKLQAYVFCPVFFDVESKTLRPSFLIQNQPIFCIDDLGTENAQIVKINPSTVSLQFKRNKKIKQIKP